MHTEQLAESVLELARGGASVADLMTILDEAIASERAAVREACAKEMEISRSAILLMAGEMTAQEMRTVRAVLQNRASVLRES